jgi:hypothetical protein
LEDWSAIFLVDHILSDFNWLLHLFMMLRKQLLHGKPVAI